MPRTSAARAGTLVHDRYPGTRAAIRVRKRSPASGSTTRSGRSRRITSASASTSAWPSKALNDSTVSGVPPGGGGSSAIARGTTNAAASDDDHRDAGETDGAGPPSSGLPSWPTEAHDQREHHAHRREHREQGPQGHEHGERQVAVQTDQVGQEHQGGEHDRDDRETGRRHHPAPPAPRRTGRRPGASPHQIGDAAGHRARLGARGAGRA